DHRHVERRLAAEPVERARSPELDECRVLPRRPARGDVQALGIEAVDQAVAVVVDPVVAGGLRVLRLRDAPRRRRGRDWYDRRRRRRDEDRAGAVAAARKERAGRAALRTRDASRRIALLT